MYSSRHAHGLPLLGVAQHGIARCGGSVVRVIVSAGCIYLSQSLSFRAPVYFGVPVSGPQKHAIELAKFSLFSTLARVEITRKKGDRLWCSTRCTDREGVEINRMTGGNEPKGVADRWRSSGALSGDARSSRVSAFLPPRSTHCTQVKLSNDPINTNTFMDRRSATYQIWWFGVANASRRQKI